MKRRLHDFLVQLRQADLAVPISAALDAAAALALVGIEPHVFREALAATLVKDEADRPTFDRVFDSFFGVASSSGTRRARRPPPSDGERGSGGRGESGSGGPPPSPSDEEPTESKRTPRTVRASEPSRALADRLDRQRRAARRPFRELHPDEIEDCIALAEAYSKHLWAHHRRRYRHSRQHTLDIRRTMRRAVSFGGVPLQREFRTRQPGKVDLVALCDVSHSCVAASEFLWALLRPAHRFFHRTRLFAYVDAAIEVEIEDGRPLPEKPIDYFRRSDFGHTLATFVREHQPTLSRTTLLLILGDGRNNRRPARADLLRTIRQRVKQVVWLNPESQDRWNSGDSAIGAYSPHCDAVWCADTPHKLIRALRQARL